MSVAKPDTVARVIDCLAENFPEAECALRHRNAFELLIAAILAAQCTDERVNQVTETLFRRYPGPDAFAMEALESLEEAVRSTGFYRNKAKAIQACCRALQDRYDGVVPETLDELVGLPGIGRKTANLVLGVAMGVASGVVVDTHVSRVSQRLGLTQETKPDKIESDLNALVPQDEWISFSHRLILQGRNVCKARKPRCDDCSMKSFCSQIGVTT